MIRKTVFIATFGGALATSMGFASVAYAQTAQDLQKQIDQLKTEADQLKETLSEQKKAGDFDKPIIVKWGPAPTISSSDGLFEMKLRGKLYSDFAWMNDNEDQLDLSASELRTARFGIQGVAWKEVPFRLRIEFGDGTARVNEAFVGKKNVFGLPFELQAGLIKIGTSIETNTSGNYVHLMERGSWKEVIGFSRKMGIGFFNMGEMHSFQFGVQRGSATKTTHKEGWVISGRGSKSFKFDENFIHMGGSLRWRKKSDDEDLLRYRARPFSHLAPRFIDTGEFAEKDLTLGLEAAFVSGPYSVESEFQTIKAKYDSAIMGVNNPRFNTGYLAATWFVTGEKRNYNPSAGGFGRPYVDNPIHNGGMGAWQVSLRYDLSDLNDEGIAGGKQKMWIGGVNWYLNRHTRLMLNYTYARISGATGETAYLMDLDGKNTVKGFAFRAQFDF